MAEAQKQSLRRGRTTPDGRKPWSPRRWSPNRALAGVAVLLTVIVAVSVTACDSSTQAASNATTTTATAGQTGLMGRPSGTPPMMRSTTTTDTATSTTLPETTTTTVEQTTTTILAEGSYSDGVYLVGTDIDSGLYEGMVNSSSGRWEISSDANGEGFIIGGDPVGQFYVKATSGRYLRLSGVTIAEASSTAADPLLSSNLTDGTYRVGYDIAAGWYQGTVNDRMGYWEVSSDANGQTLVANDYAMGPFTVKVKSGQYITLRGVTITQ